MYVYQHQLRLCACTHSLSAIGNYNNTYAFQKGTLCDVTVHKTTLRSPLRCTTLRSYERKKSLMHGVELGIYQSRERTLHIQPRCRG